MRCMMLCSACEFEHLLFVSIAGKFPTDLTDLTDFTDFLLAALWGHAAPLNLTDDVGTTSKGSHGFDTAGHPASRIFLTTDSTERKEIC